MGPLGICEIVVIAGVIGIVAVAVRLVVAFVKRRPQDLLLQQAIEANQPEVAIALIRARWSGVSLVGLVLAGAGLALLAALAWQPQELAGLLVLAGVLLCAGTPMVLFGYFQLRAEGRPSVVAWVVPAIGSLAAAGAVFGVGARVHFGSMPSPQEIRDFRHKVYEMTGASLGTGSPMIEGHQARACLTGNAYATQSCGTPYHDGIRFATTGQGFLNVFYIPDTDQYVVIGRARVSPAGVIVENGFISAQEALGQTGGRAH